RHRAVHLAAHDEPAGMGRLRHRSGTRLLAARRRDRRGAAGDRIWGAGTGDGRDGTQGNPRRPARSQRPRDRREDQPAGRCIVNPEWSDEELERWVREAREKVISAARNRVLRDARVERSYAPIESPPGKKGDEKLVETAWLLLGVVTVVVLALCFHGAL